MPVGTKGTVKSLDPDELRTVGARDHPRQHLPPALPPGRRGDRRARRAARVLGLGRADPHRLRRLPGLLAPRHAARGRRRRRHVPLGLRRRAGAVHARARRRRSSATSAPTSRCASTSARRPACPRAELEEAVRLTTLWAGAAAAKPSARRGQLLFGIAQGAADPELRRRSIAEITALDFDGHALGGLAVGESREEMFEADRLGGAAAAGGEAALLHGHRRRRGDPARDRRAGSTCSTASSRRGPPAPARR